MTDNRASLLGQLEILLGDRARDMIYPCIADLAEHGVEQTRFPEGATIPHRQVITQYLAAWGRHAGLTEDDSRSWLVDYCLARHLATSSKSPAAMRHSTKSNVRYIYRSAVPFRCNYEDNPFRAHCRPECPFYAGKEARLREEAIQALNPRPVPPPQPPVIQPVLTVKAVYLEQFQLALRLAQEEIAKGTKLQRITDMLNAQGLKTRTGRPWRHPILRAEIMRIRYPKALPPDASNTNSGDPANL